MAISGAPLILVLIVAAVFEGCYAEVMIRYAGLCPKMDAVSFFNPNVFKGVWFEYGNVHQLFNDIGRCTKYMFSESRYGLMDLELSGKNILNFQTVNTRGTAVVTGSSGILSVKFPLLMTYPTQYLVLGTDYTSWAVLWTCQDKTMENIQNLIVLTRQQAPLQFTIESALRAIDYKNLSRFGFKPIDQTFC